MQIFRPFKSHEKSARYLDDKRLNKQVLETYQIIRVILGQMRIIDANTRYLSHPIVKHVYNNGRPYLIDLYRYLVACDNEWQRRGKNRGTEFAGKIAEIGEIINANKNRLLDDRLPLYFVSGEVKATGDKVPRMYRRLLRDKWRGDTGSTVKASIKLFSNVRR